MLKVIKAKSKEVKKSKNGYYFGVLFIDSDKWFNIFESNKEIIDNYYNDFKKGISIDVDIEGNIIKDYRLDDRIDNIEEEVVKDNKPIDRNKSIFMAQCFNVATEVYCKMGFSIIKEDEAIERIFNISEKFYQEGIKRGYGK